MLTGPKVFGPFYNHFFSGISKSDPRDSHLVRNTSAMRSNHNLPNDWFFHC
jgi:hypothetical protein